MDVQRPADAGETLVELLVAIVLLGIASAAVIGTITMGIKAASTTAGYGNNQNTLRNWAEQIEAMPYDLCAYPTQPVAPYPNAAVLPAGTTLTMSQIRYWDGSAYVVSGGACVDANDKGLQELTLTASTTAAAPAPPTSTLVVVKRRGCASGC